MICDARRISASAARSLAGSASTFAVRSTRASRAASFFRAGVSGAAGASGTPGADLASNPPGATRVKSAGSSRSSPFQRIMAGKVSESDPVDERAPAQPVV